MAKKRGRDEVVEHQSDQEIVFATIAGATTGSTAFLVSLGDSLRIIETHGQGLMPLELPGGDLYARFVEVCNSLYTVYSKKFGEVPPLLCLTCALSSKTAEEEKHQLLAAANDSLLGPLGREKLTWITRGRACCLASREPGDTVILKVGTVAFAHAFRQRAQYAEECRVGGWGLLSGADGGGYDIGRQMLYRLFREYDGREPKSEFGSEMLARMGIESLVDVARWIRRQRIEYSFRLEVAKLARVAVYLAEQGDPTCKSILQNAASTVAESCKVAVETLRDRNVGFGADGISLIFHGGLVQYSSLYLSYLLEQLRARLGATKTGSLRWRTLRYRPVVGALIYSLQACFQLTNAEIGLRLRELEEQRSVRLINDYSTDVRTLLREWSSDE